MSQDLLDPIQRNDGNIGGQLPLPNATAVLVLGILSIVGCILYGIPGIICGIIAIVMHRKDKELYESNPSIYEDSFKNSKAGFICGIIGTSLSAVFMLAMIVYAFAVMSALTMIR